MERERELSVERKKKRKERKKNIQSFMIEQFSSCFSLLLTGEQGSGYPHSPESGYCPRPQLLRPDRCLVEEHLCFNTHCFQLPGTTNSLSVASNYVIKLYSFELEETRLLRLFANINFH